MNRMPTSLLHSSDPLPIDRPQAHDPQCRLPIPPTVYCRAPSTLVSQCLLHACKKHVSWHAVLDGFLSIPRSVVARHSIWPLARTGIPPQISWRLHRLILGSLSPPLSSRSQLSHIALPLITPLHTHSIHPLNTLPQYTSPNTRPPHTHLPPPTLRALHTLHTAHDKSRLFASHPLAPHHRSTRRHRIAPSLNSMVPSSSSISSSSP